MWVEDGVVEMDLFGRNGYFPIPADGIANYTLYALNNGDFWASANEDQFIDKTHFDQIITSHDNFRLNSSELWRPELIDVPMGPLNKTSDVIRFEYGIYSYRFYNEHCVENANKKLIRVFMDENGKVKHICFIKSDNAHSVLDQ